MSDSSLRTGCEGRGFRMSHSVLLEPPSSGSGNWENY